ncbi:MAG: hypothetical protein AB1486_00905 [Planctomycetota bacterium]
MRSYAESILRWIEEERRQWREIARRDEEMLELEVAEAERLWKLRNGAPAQAELEENDPPLELADEELPF